MSRHSWSRQESYLPYPAGTVPYVTDQDFSYITSEDIDPVPQNPRHSNPIIVTPLDYEEDDVLHIVFDHGHEYRLNFPAYSIGDGRLRVRDIQKRIAFVRDIPDHRIPFITLEYKRKKLRDPEQLVRAYGCKNNSELRCTISDRSPEHTAANRHHESAVGSGSESDTVVVTDEYGRVVNRGDHHRRRSSFKHRDSPRTSGASLHIQPSSTMGNSSSKRAASRMREKPMSPAMKTLEELAEHFETTLRPLCEEFARSPPVDKQKREEEHKRLEETTMQQVILKLDEVQADGDDEIRTRRKELVNHVQDVLKLIDRQKE